MMKIKFFLTIVISAAALTSCNKSENDIDDGNGNVYVVGDVNGVVTIWKNGVAQNLSDGTYVGRANFVFVLGRDVYVAGYEESGQEYTESYRGFTRTHNRKVAKLWKNGVAQNLTDGTYDAEAHSVFVSESGVYVAGVEANGQEYQLYGIRNHAVAKLWKNGVAQNLNDGTHSAWASSVFVSGQDMYVVGDDNADLGEVAVLWKNGIAQNLSYKDQRVSVRSVFVSGNDVYVAGYEISTEHRMSVIAVLWKNGVKQNLTDISFIDTWASSVFVSGKDVYVAGTGRNAEYEDFAVLWKNGVKQNLTDINRNSDASSVFVSKNDVYVTGTAQNEQFNYDAVIWKNGVRQDLTDGSAWASANSVFVK